MLIGAGEEGSQLARGNGTWISLAQTSVLICRALVLCFQQKDLAFPPFCLESCNKVLNSQSLIGIYESDRWNPPTPSLSLSFRWCGGFFGSGRHATRIALPSLMDLVMLRTHEMIWDISKLLILSE